MEMGTASPMVCARCNALTDAVEKCSKCGTRLKTLESQQRRGWISFGAGAFMVVFVSAVWIWVDRILAANATMQPDTSAFAGRLNLAFALLVISGALGVASGWYMAQTGLRNRWLIVALVLAFLVGLFVAGTASSGLSAS